MRDVAEHVLLTPLSPVECCRRLEARCLPPDERWALQLRWRPPPRHLAVTASGDPERFIMAQTLPIQPRKSLFA